MTNLLVYVVFMLGLGFLLGHMGVSPEATLGIVLFVAFATAFLMSRFGLTGGSDGKS